MIKENVYEIGQTYIRLDFKADQKYKNEFEKYLLSKGKEYTKIFFKNEYLIDGLFFQVELEDGSLKGRLKIFGKIAIGGLIAYGGIRTGIDYIIKDSQTINECIVRDIANEPNIDPNSIGRVERRLGIPGKIKRLYNEMDRLSRDRNNLTENEENVLIANIQKHYEELVFELDQHEISFIKQDILLHQIPLPQQNQDNVFFPRQFAIRNDDIELISEDEIHEMRQLPPIE